MFVFPKQKQFNVGGVVVGGQMVNPAVLVGTIFYGKESLFRGSGGGFDGERAAFLIQRQEDLSRETGIPCMVDVYADSVDVVRERIDFVCDVFDGPFLIDSTEASVRLAGLSFAEEAGLADRVVYNSINAGSGPDELEAIKSSSVSSALLLAFNPLSSALEGKMRMLEDGGGSLTKGLIEVSVECGIKKPLVDTGITPLGEGASSAVRALTAVKARFGLPVGCGIHNAVISWRWPGDKNRLFADAASNVLARVVGADFILYGPIERAEKVFSSVAFAECLIGEACEELGFDVSGSHPSSLLR